MSSENQKSSGLTPFVVAIVLFAIVGALWLYLDRQREKYLRELVHSEATLHASLIDADIRARLPSLQRMVDRWVIRGGTPKAEFIADAESYIHDLPGFQALEWVDSDFHIRWIMPMKGNEKALNLNLAFEEKRRISLEEAQKKRSPTMSSLIDLVQGGKGFLIYFPIYVENRFDGFLLAVFVVLGPDLF